MLTPSDKALVPFVSVDHMMQLIHHIGIEDALKGLADYIEADFRRWELFDKSPRVASHSPEGVIELMPTSDGEVYGFKYVNGHPKNTADGLQTVTAFGLLADVATGYPVLLSEMTMLTAMRTAATSALVARVLAPKGAATMAMIGNMVGAGVHINAIGGDCPGKTELAPAILQRSDIFVEFPAQTRIEGEIQQLAPDHPVTEFWEVLSGAKPGRTSQGQITLFDSVGFATEDFSALRYVRDRIAGTDYFHPLDLLADPDDPRDLFGMLQRSKG